MEVILGDAKVLSDQLYSDLGRYRHDVFVGKLGWKLDVAEGMERDQFDREDTIHVVARNERNEVVGYARLLPTVRPYLLGDLFPELLNGAAPPQSPEVWELSRFAAGNIKGSANRVESQFPSDLAVEILTAAADFARRRGARRLITVSPLAIERLLRKTGFHVHRAGPPMLVEGHPTFACWIEIDEQ